jgi:3-methyladenine DNA glycosylase AlkD
LISASSTDAATAIVAATRAALTAAADPAKAGPMQAYMKSTMPYLGVQSTPLRAALKEVFAAHPLPTEGTWRRAVVTLWRKATHREERYAAIALTGHRLYRAYQTMKLLPLYEELVVTGAWWDLVDDVAVHRLGPMLLAHGAPMRKSMSGWARSGDMWKQRAAIICQVLAKEQTDLKLLYACIGPSLSSREFFFAQGYRLGASRLRLDRPPRGRALRARARAGAERPQQTRGAQELELALASFRNAPTALKKGSSHSSHEMCPHAGSTTF